MIYEVPSQTDPIRQGDIFVRVPRIEFDMTNMIELDGDGPRPVIWRDLANARSSASIVVSVAIASGIVITQDCDASRTRDISLCEIRIFGAVYTNAATAKSPKGMVSIITKHARENLKWFYLPACKTVGFDENMAVDYGTVIRVSRQNLEDNLDLRIGRLNDLANEHFRERLSEYFRRYAFDEWYSLNHEEFAEYCKAYPNTEPFPWQRKPGS